MGRPPRRLRLGLRRLGLLHLAGRRRPARRRPHARPARRVEPGRQGRGVRRHRDRDPRARLHRPARGRPGAVLPAGGALRAAQPRQRAAALRRRPAVPAGLPGPPDARAPRGQLRRAAVRPAGGARPAGVRRPAWRQPASAGRRATRPRLARRAARAATRRWRWRPCATGPGWRSRPTVSCSGSSTPSATTPTSCSPPTTASTSARSGSSLGKGTPYSPDVQVPLLVVGPGVPPGSRGELATNLDLAPTLEDLAGLTPAPFRSGASLVPSLRDPKARTRDYVFHEHTRPGTERRRPRPHRRARRDPVVRRGPQPHPAARALRPRPRSPAPASSTSSTT